MVFSDTTLATDGLIQSCEFWTRHKDGGISGAPVLLKQFTARINRGFDRVMPLVLSYSDYIRWDDVNHTDLPIGRVDIVSGQPDYKITEDDNSLDILNVTRVRALLGASETEYKDLKRMFVDDPLAVQAMSPNPSVSGVPTHFLESGGKIFLYPEPNYSATSGLEIFFEREQSYFASTDTTKEPGIPKPFHELLALHPSLDWNRVNRTKDTGLLNEIRAEIQKQEQQLFDLISLRNPTHKRLQAAYQDNR